MHPFADDFSEEVYTAGFEPASLILISNVKLPGYPFNALLYLFIRK